MRKYIAVAGARCPEIAKERLLSLTEVSDVVLLPPDSQISAPICDHPDSLICIFDGKLFVHSLYSEIAKDELSYICRRCDLELMTIDCERGPAYPSDCGFNALAIPDHSILIGRKKSLAPPIADICSADTNQGYAACTSLYAGRHVITADPSIEKAAIATGLPVYKISGKGISLPGYNEGFIGGAGGAFDHTVCIFGAPHISESAVELSSFCREKGLHLVSLEEGPLTDRGGIKFLEIGE
ncbi:MAG: hypothetical protein IJA52_08210 [Clostridia bacterium]|nr:hypothetical protein [Clostridia bacterium]